MSNRDVSPDSSTQPKEEHRKVRKQKHHSHGRNHKNKKKKKEEKNPVCELQIPASVNSSSSKNSKRKTRKRKNIKQQQLSSTIKPLGEYVDDREELFKEVLRTISKKKLKEMLPDILKKEDLKEVKRLCLEQLKTVPVKKLKDIISGQDTSLSGDEDKESKECDESQLAAMLTVTAPEEKQVNLVSELVDLQDSSAASIAEEEKDAEIFEELITAPNQEEIDELVEGSPEDRDEEQAADHNQANIHDEIPVTLDEKPTPSEELQLKELEFRARALKSLVQARERQMKVAGKSPFSSTS